MKFDFSERHFVFYFISFMNFPIDIKLLMINNGNSSLSNYVDALFKKLFYECMLVCSLASHPRLPRPYHWLDNQYSFHHPCTHTIIVIP
jgi:hypothetical protein